MLCGQVTLLFEGGRGIVVFGGYTGERMEVISGDVRVPR